MFPFFNGDATDRRSLKILKSFQSDEQGSIGIMFGLMVIPTIMLVGVAVDIGRMISVRNQTQVILDNAALAGGRAAQLASTNKSQAASTAAKAYFNAQVVPHAILPKISDNATTSADGTEFTWTVETWVRTPFISSASIRKTINGDTTSPQPCPVSGWFCKKIVISASSILAVGGNNSDTNIETSLMLDVTGSMSGTKITDLKLAAKDLIDIVVWDNQSDVKSRVAIAPFAEAVNVGTTLAPLVRGAVTNGTNPTTDNPGTGYQYFKFTKKGGGGTYTYKISTACVTERPGAAAYTDAAPDTATTRVGRHYPSTSGTCSLENSDAEVNTIQPLSNDKTMLKRRIDKLKLAGSTAGQIGTAWAWYLLSPNFNYLFPTASASASYTAEKNKKIAVLMTDGDYNTEYWNGVESKSSYSADSNFNPTNGTAESQAPQLCTAMKAKGIEVYTVGFQVSSAAKTLLKNCATDANHYYDATSGEALRQSFRDIALKISTLRLSK